VNQHRNLPLEQTERFCSLSVENAFDALNFEKMIARAERAELIDPPLLGALRHGIRAGRCEAAVLFDQFRIRFARMACGDRPVHASVEHCVKLLVAKLDSTAAESPKCREQFVAYPLALSDTWSFRQTSSTTVASQPSLHLWTASSWWVTALMSSIATADTIPT